MLVRQEGLAAALLPEDQNPDDAFVVRRIAVQTAVQRHQREEWLFVWCHLANTSAGVIRPEERHVFVSLHGTQQTTDVLAVVAGKDRHPHVIHGLIFLEYGRAL